MIKSNFPSIESSLGNLNIHQNLDDFGTTIYFKDWMSWDVDTEEVSINKFLTHFVESSGEVVGIKVFGDPGTEDEGQVCINGIPIISIFPLITGNLGHKLTIPSDYVEVYSEDEIQESVLCNLGMRKNTKTDRDLPVWVTSPR